MRRRSPVQRLGSFQFSFDTFQQLQQNYNFHKQSKGVCQNNPIYKGYEVMLKKMRKTILRPIQAGN